MKRQAFIIVGLSFGDEGKGSVVDYLARVTKAHTVIRYNGGSQAAHNVITADGRHHTFAQFGSATFVPGVRTYLSRYMLVNPMNMYSEADHLRALGITDAFARTSIDERALIITPFHKAINRLRELARGNQRHGSTGEGIGETMQDFLTYGQDSLFAGDLRCQDQTKRKLQLIFNRKRNEAELLLAQLQGTDEAQQHLHLLRDPSLIDTCAEVYSHFASQVAIVESDHLARLLAESGAVIFEGAQGVLLDERYGFHPHTTWSTTTMRNAETLLSEVGYDGQLTKLGLVRAYASRHGAGPFVTEDARLTQLLPDDHNVNNAWQQTFRVGYFDIPSTHYAMAAAGSLDGLVVSHLDRLTAFPEWKICTGYTVEQSADKYLSTYFDLNGSTVTNIRMHNPPDLDHQTQLTNLVSRAIPQYKTIGPVRTHEAASAYLQILESHLQLPIALSSYGPTAGDKRCHFVA